MALRVGIVGLPNVGKSTLFNALTKTKAAEAQNYPFCTIDPNVGIVEVPDPRLHKISSLMQPDKTIPAAIEFYDIAGLVEGASKGEGLGNKFLSHIRECEAIAHVVRNFEDKNVTHVSGSLNVQRDRETIENELLLADIETVEKRLAKVSSQAKSGDAALRAQQAFLERLMEHFNAAKQASTFECTSDDEHVWMRELHLLSRKPKIYIVNTSDDAMASFDASQLGFAQEETVIPVSAKLESELFELAPDEQQAFLDDLGIAEGGLDAFIRSAYGMLGLQTYFTAGKKEVRAWTIPSNTKAPQAAGVIHTDFEKGFIKADVYHFDDLIDAGDEQSIREKGLIRIEGKNYLVKDGDIMFFKFSS